MFVKGKWRVVNWTCPHCGRIITWYNTSQLRRKRDMHLRHCRLHVRKQFFGV